MPDYTEIARQEYAGNNCVFSAGFVEGAVPPVDTMFIRLEKDGAEPTIIHLRPDEMAALAWIITGTLWSHMMDQAPVNNV